MNRAPASASAVNPLLPLVELFRRARMARSAEELAFLVVNDTHAICAYRQGALWFAGSGVGALSGVVEPESDAPYAQWLDSVCRVLHETQREAAGVGALTLADGQAGEWAEWLPPYGLWLPFSGATEAGEGGGLLLAAERPWSEDAIVLLQEWIDGWHYA